MDFPWTETQALNAGIILMVVSLFLYVLRAATFPQHRGLHMGAWGTLCLSFLALAAALTVRSVDAGYFALSNMFESLLVLTMGMQAAFLVLDARFKQPGLGWPVVLLCFVAISYGLTLPRDILPLQAALVSYWRSIHVPVILTSYALFAISFLTSVAFLITEALSKSGGPNTLAVEGPALEHHPETDPADTTTATTVNTDLDWGTALPESTSTTGVVARTQNPYAEITYRTVSLGVPLLVIGIILGGLWANEAWGNYWSWDPKESMSLVTLLGYGVYLHMRVNGGHREHTLAWVSIIAFCLLLVTYFGVNIMGVGLHSYGKIG